MSITESIVDDTHGFSRLREGDNFRLHIRRRFWWKPWTWLKKNYHDTKVKSINGDSIIMTIPQN